jgi:hypothetical protein
MPGCIVAEETIKMGEETFVEGASPSTQYAVVFEDNGETGYIYACNTSRENCIVDAMQLYNVKNVTDKHLASEVIIAWSEDGLKAGLFLNRYPHAIFDFAARRGYCRSNFPVPSEEWSFFHQTHEWDEKAVELLS